MASYQQGTILLTGGTGTVASGIVPLLDAQSIPYVIACRSGGTASASLSSVHFDWMDSSTWEAALTSTAASSPPITSIFLVSPAVPHSSTIMNDFIDLARGPAYGVKRFVLLAATAVEAGGPFFGGTMGYLAELGGKGEIEFAVLRPTWFQNNWAERDNIRRPLQEEGKVYSATADGKVPWVSKYDISACAFHALTAKESVDGDLVILGPELLSYSDCARILSDVLGKEIVHVHLSTEELAKRHHEIQGLPEEYAKILAAMDTSIKNGSEEIMNDVVLGITGKKPTTFREFAEANKAAWL
ncbi:family ergot alkaloid biosynthesis protein [Coniella lustricola]|uniref:Family ergot alkaloid biosynthesis protein n=1 Tax=Coniella lustricola TaxID=2025994 RepID=A0A2T3AEJ4_9PEZI|nr:family ergot alkaloid biosynthesis protein [Coniella lustricola]